MRKQNIAFIIIITLDPKLNDLYETKGAKKKADQSITIPMVFLHFTYISLKTKTKNLHRAIAKIQVSNSLLLGEKKISPGLRIPVLSGQVQTVALLEGSESKAHQISANL